MSHEKYQSLIETLHECMTACNHCYDSCLKEDHVGMMVECIRMDRECADMCAFFEQSLSRGTPFEAQLARACAEMCEACGNECKKHDHDHCQKCAEACFKCADECKSLIA